MGEEFTPKDFRTWAGTLIAAVKLADLGVTQDLGKAEQNVLAAVGGGAGARAPAPTAVRGRPTTGRLPRRPTSFFAYRVRGASSNGSQSFCFKQIDSFDVTFARAVELPLAGTQRLPVCSILRARLTEVGVRCCRLHSRGRFGAMLKLGPERP